MTRHLSDFLPRPRNLFQRTQRVLASAALAVYGIVGVAPSPAVAAAASAPSTVPVTAPTIVDRSKKAAKLVLALPGHALNQLIAQHRSHASHRSHSSHSSHSSHVSGASVPAPKPAPATPPATTTPPAAPVAAAGLAALNAESASGTNFVGVIEMVDQQARHFRVKAISPENRHTMAFRDDTMVETASGQRMRLDEYRDANQGRFPFAVGDRVQVFWSTHPMTKVTSATTIVRAK